MSRKISQVGISLIKSFEGCRLTAYKPVPTETYWTIGWGHYGPDVKAGMTITQAQADSMLL
ncbi:lysozyme, partial [Paenibacillus odorifer]